MEQKPPRTMRMSPPARAAREQQRHVGHRLAQFVVGVFLEKISISRMWPPMFSLI